MGKGRLKNDVNKYVCSHYYMSIVIGVIIHFFSFFVLFLICKNTLFSHPWFTHHRIDILKIILLVVCPVILSLYGLEEGYHIYRKKVRIVIPEVEREIKICHLSDVHLGALFRKSFLKRIIKKVDKMQPDFVVITGDLFDGTRDVGLDWLSLFHQLKMPIYYVTGNHEVYFGEEKALALLEQTNITHLQRNKPITFENLLIYGHDYKDNEEIDGLDFYNFCKKIPRTKGFVNVVLQHIPSVSCEFLAKTNVDLLLCGHTHGGPIFPVNLFLYMGNSCSKGLYKKNGHYVYVSNGVGTCVTPMRVTARSNIDEIIICKN